MFEDRVKKVSKVDLNLENVLESVIHFLPNYLHNETFMRGIASKICTQKLTHCFESAQLSIPADSNQ